MKNLLIIFLLLLFGSSCKREKTSGPTTLTGRMLDATDNRSVANARVFLSSKNKDCTSALCYKTEASAITDDDGNFSIDFNMDENKWYTLYGRAEHYFDNNIGEDINNAGKQSRNIFLEPKGYLKILLINEPPIEPANTNFYFFGELEPSILFAKPLNDTFKIATCRANRNISLKMRTTKNGNYIYEDFTKYIIAIDTTEFIIKY